METVTPQPIDKPKRIMTDAQLEKLKLAREMALKKRREMAAVRAVDREALVLQKIDAKQARDDVKAEREATRRFGQHAVESTTDQGAELQDAETKLAAMATKRMRTAVVVETSDSDEEEGLIDNARVFVVRRDRERPTIAAAPKPATPTPAPTSKPVEFDPHADLYARMFG